MRKKYAVGIVIFVEAKRRY